MIFCRRFARSGRTAPSWSKPQFLHGIWDWHHYCDNSLKFMKYFLRCTFILPAVLLSQGNLQPTISAIRCLTQSVYLYLGEKRLLWKYFPCLHIRYSKYFPYLHIKYSKYVLAPVQDCRDCQHDSVSHDEPTFGENKLNFLAMSNCVKLYIYNRMTLGRDSKCKYKVGVFI